MSLIKLFQAGNIYAAGEFTLSGRELRGWGIALPIVKYRTKNIWRNWLGSRCYVPLIAWYCTGMVGEGVVRGTGGTRVCWVFCSV